MVQQIWRNELKLWKHAIVHEKKQRLNKNQILNVDMISDDNPSVIHNVKNQSTSIESYPSTIQSIIQARLDNIQQRARQILQFMDIISS